MTRLSVEKLDEIWAFSRLYVLTWDTAFEPCPSKWRKKAGNTGKQPQIMPQLTYASLEEISDVEKKALTGFDGNIRPQSQMHDFIRQVFAVCRVNTCDEASNSSEASTTTRLGPILDTALQEGNYKSLNTNTVGTPSRCFRGSCKRQILMSGTKMEISEAMLMQAVTIIASLMFTQRPGSFGLKIFALGTHWKISTKASAVKEHVQPNYSVYHDTESIVVADNE